DGAAAGGAAADGAATGGAAADGAAAGGRHGVAGAADRGGGDRPGLPGRVGATGIDRTAGAIGVGLVITLAGLGVGPAESVATRRRTLAAQAAAGVPRAVLG